MPKFFIMSKILANPPLCGPRFQFFAKIRPGISLIPLGLLLFVLLPFSVSAEKNTASVYQKIREFPLSGANTRVSDMVLKRDRAEMTFNGTFYFMPPVEGRVLGAVFIGEGTFRAEVPPSIFEQNHVERLFGTNLIESNFKTAVLRFSDDTYRIIGQTADPNNSGAVPADAQKLAGELDQRMLKETGANISSRLNVSLANNEPEGFFLANFDGGKRGRFTFLYDPQTRIPTYNFNINGGEKGLIFSFESAFFENEVWMAFHSLEEYQQMTSTYSDVNDLVDIEHYDMEIDLRDPGDRVGLKATVKMSSRFENLSAIPFSIGENLRYLDDQRLDKQMRLKSVTVNGGEPAEFVQEDWEGGFTVLLPEPVARGQNFTLTFELAGDFMRRPPNINHTYYPRSNTSWYPRHGFLDRATYNFKYLHSKKHKIASVGLRRSEEKNKEDDDLIETIYQMRHPIALATFAIGPFERHKEMIKWDNGDKPIEIEFSSLPGSYLPIKESFILAELNNSVRFFHALFGPYPYDNFGASFHPYGFGQGFPSMLMIPPTDRANKYTYSFLSHETAHQWWGNIIAWRSYRDQWLSEGFAEYSGVLYTSLRDDPKAALNLIDNMRDSLKDSPRTVKGLGKGKLVDVGPIILGHRLRSTKTLDAYSTLIYNKGALVLRMLHFLLSDPASGDDKLFYDMMKDFVGTYRNSVASSDDFRLIAGKHFAQSPIARKYGLQNLDWFFAQWVYDSKLPAYELKYEIIDQPDGTFVVQGEVLQENAGEKWFMPLPLEFSFGGKQRARGTVHAYGPKTPFSIKLPVRPKKVDLDPDKWVLSEKTKS